MVAEVPEITADVSFQIVLETYFFFLPLWWHYCPTAASIVYLCPVNMKTITWRQWHLVPNISWKGVIKNVKNNQMLLSDLKIRFQESEALFRWRCSAVEFVLKHRRQPIGKLRQHLHQHDTSLTTAYPSSHLIELMFRLVCEYSPRGEKHFREALN